MKITVLESIGIPKSRILELAKKITDKGHELSVYDDNTKDVEILKERVSDADILVIANSELSGEVIKAAEKLKMISVAFTGVDHVDLNVCKEKNIIVSNSAGYSVPAVAELAFGMMISIFRNMVPLNTVTRSGGTMKGYSQRELHGKTLGVVGTGDIGSKVIDIGLAFGCDIVAFNRSEKEDLKAKGVKYMSLEEVFKKSDIVSLHLPLTDETKGMVNEKMLNHMKKESILINTARGAIVDNSALAQALKEKKISGAGIDVFDMEPPLPLEYELLKEKSALLTPHIGFATSEAMIRRAYIVFENISSYIDGKPQNVIK